MLKFMRKHAGSLVIKFLLVVIIIVFVLWGAGNFSKREGIEAAVINDEPVTMEEFNSVYNRTVEYYRQSYKDRLDDDMIRQLKLKQKAMDSLVDEKIILHEAIKLNFKVSDMELEQSILQFDAFKTNGKFNKKAYINILKRYHMTPESFEQSQKEMLLTRKLRNFITDSFKVSDDEALQWYNWNKAKVKIDYIMIEPKNYKDINPSDDELKSWFESKRANYKTDPKVKAKYVRFDADVYKKDVEVKDEEIKDYYDTHLAEFTKEKTVSARHILFKTSSDMKDEEKEEKRKKALEIMELANKGDDFAELAKKHSEGPSAKNGGDLGEFKKNAMVKPFADKAFSMKPGEVSEPVETSFGWHIIKVEKVNEETVTSLEDAKVSISEKLTKEKTKVIASEKADDFLSLALDQGNIEKAATQEKIEIKTTDFFSRRDSIKDVKNSSRFSSVAFGLSKDQISNVEDLEDAYYIIEVIDTLESKPAEFDGVKQKVRNDYIKEKQDEKAKQDADALMAAIKKGALPEEEAKKYNAELKTTAFFDRSGSIPDIGYDRGLSDTVFTLSKAKPVPEKVAKGSKGYFYIRLNEKKLPESKEFDKEKEGTKEQLLRLKRANTFEKWLTQAREKSHVQILIDLDN